MKRLFLRLLRHQRTWRQPQPTLSVYVEMYRGSLIGFVVCLLGAIAVGGLAGVALWAALFGAGIGALNGLLLWVGSDQFDEQAVTAPHRPLWRAQANLPLPRRPPGRMPHYADSGRHPVRPRAQRKR